MTRINTNVSSLVAQNTLSRNTADLQQALTRLSTGLQINTGKDDPAGLIASEALRSDITSIEKAISNSTRANLMIATADSALGQVSNLLNDIRGLVVEAANEGALSVEQIEANQLQVDSSLEAINRIAQTTTFQGRRLLDGSLDFNTNSNTVSTIVDLQIDQANLGSTGQVAVSVEISAAATVAEVQNTDGFTAASNAYADITLSTGVAIENGVTGTFLEINSLALDSNAGVTVDFVDSNDGGAAVNDITYDGSTITVTADLTSGIAASAIATAINADADVNGEFIASSTGAGTFVAGDAGVGKGTLAADVLRLTAQTAGADYNGVRVSVTAGVGNTATYDADQNTLAVQIDNTGSQTLTTLATDIDTALDGDFDAAVQTSSSGVVNASAEAVEQTQNTGSTGGNVLKDELVLSIGGSIGREVFNFDQSASVNQVVAAINLVSDATGVVASQSSGTLVLNSIEYGSQGIVDTEVISEGAAGAFEASWIGGNSRAEGNDIAATVNGVSAQGDGNTLSINTATLDLAVTVSEGSDTNFVFDITGGGALFQLGPDVVSNQQARLGIQSLYTANLGGASGRLYELASGGDKTLTNDPNSAYQVVGEVISKVATLRGRLGAFQRTTVETNIASLSDTLVNLTDAESAIRDADFAKESSELTRAQILVQSGTSVLGIANSTPQSVLSLLR
jgi:flagellin